MTASRRGPEVYLVFPSSSNLAFVVSASSLRRFCMQAVVRETERQFCIDRRRIFATGQSNGGMMTEQLGLDPRTAELFAAGVQVSGAPLHGFNEPPVAPYALMSLRGTADPVIPYAASAMDPSLPPPHPGAPQNVTTSNDGFYYHAEADVMATWAAAQQCGGDGSQRYPTEFDGHQIDLKVALSLLLVMHAPLLFYTLIVSVSDVRGVPGWVECGELHVSGEARASVE